MTCEWQPGDVALAPDRFGRSVRVLLTAHCLNSKHDDRHPHWHYETGGWAATDTVTARPLVVLDPESDEDVERLAQAIWPKGVGDHGVQRASETLNRLANLTPPKPAEPTEFGARVRDRAGVLWLRVHGPGPWRYVWRNNGGPMRSWADLDIPADGVES